jgi:hypothetical protein
MGLLHKIMCKLGRYRLIPDRRTGEDYMHRYYLMVKDRTKFPLNITLHKIVKSDDPILHDHPWPYLTVILRGGYHEHTPIYNDNGKMLGTVSKWRGPGSIIFRKAKEFHWLELDKKIGPATTLFIMGPQQRDWGFLVYKKKESPQWIQWNNYLDNYQDYHKEYIEPKILKRKAA